MIYGDKWSWSRLFVLEQPATSCIIEWVHCSTEATAVSSDFFEWKQLTCGGLNVSSFLLAQWQLRLQSGLAYHWEDQQDVSSRGGCGDSPLCGPGHVIVIWEYMIKICELNLDKDRFLVLEGRGGRRDSEPASIEERRWTDFKNIEFNLIRTFKGTTYWIVNNGIGIQRADLVRDQRTMSNCVKQSVVRVSIYHVVRDLSYKPININVFLCCVNV